MLPVISDTSPVFYLATLNYLSFLPRLYEKILMPEVVWEEAIRGGEVNPKISILLRAALTDGWLLVRQVEPVSHPALAGLDAGERAAILLALQFDRSLLLIDEKAGRLTAKGLGLEFTGTLGILLRAKAHGLLPAIRPALDALSSQTTFRLHQDLAILILKEAGEL